MISYRTGKPRSPLKPGLEGIEDHIDKIIESGNRLYTPIREGKQPWFDVKYRKRDNGKMNCVYGYYVATPIGTYGDKKIETVEGR